MAAPLVPSNWQLPPLLQRRLGRSVGRQRLMTHEDHLLIVAHDVPLLDESDRRGVLFWRDSAGEWRSSNGEPGTVAIENLLAKYDRKLDEFEQAEMQSTRSEEYLPLLEGLAPVARAANNFYTVMQEARKTFPDVTELIDWRDHAYDVSRTAELTYQYAKDSMDVAVVKRAEDQAAASDRMARAAHKLNMMAALFFPLATLGSIFGTTLTDNWSWADTPQPFLLFLTGGLVSGVLLAMFVGSRAKT